MIPHQSSIVSRTEPTISYPFVTALCDAVGEDKEIVKAGLRHFELSGLAADVTRVPLRRYIGLFEWLAVELDHPYLGLELSQQTGPETLGAISYMFLGSRNLEMVTTVFSISASRIAATTASTRSAMFGDSCKSFRQTPFA
jgi:hypothetical protein